MPLPHKPAAIIFDMDGLIFDTETLYQQAFLAAATQDGHDLPLTLIQSTVGVPWTRSRVLLLEYMGADFPVDDYFTRVVVHFDLLSATDLRLKPGVLDLLDLLDALDLPRAIATSSSHATVQSHLAAHRLAARFPTVIAHGDYAHGKPAPDPFLLAAERLGIDPRHCIALEDSHNGVRSAAAAGMMTFMVPDLLSPTEEIRALCTGIVTDLHGICALVRASLDA